MRGSAGRPRPSASRPLIPLCHLIFVRWRRRCGRAVVRRAVLACFFVAPLCLAQTPQQQALVAPAGGNLLVLEVRLDNYLVSEGLTAYQVGERVLLPLGELARLLTLAIRTEPEQGTASGFVLTEDRRFYLNIPKAVVTLGERVETLDPALVLVYPDDIYVASELLSRWLPLDLDVNFSSLILRVQAREPLPLQRRLQRERDASQARSPYMEVDPGYPRHSSPYSLWDPPFIDHTLAMELSKGRGSSSLSARHSTFITGDLLGFESAIFLGGTADEPIDNFRATLGRNDPEARLLGPLRARAFAFGNIAVPALANVARTSPTGNGVLVSNLPLTRPSTFRRHSFHGDLPPGWDVELYFNDALIAFQSSRPDGRYVFEDVPLVYGPNEFRLVFHGPQGQVRVERQSFLLQDTLTRPGEVRYQVAAHRSSRDETRSFAQFDVGLGNHLSATGGVSTLSVLGADRTYSNLGVRAQAGRFFLTGDVISSDGGLLAEMGLLTRVAGVSLALSHAEARNFTSELFLPVPDAIRGRDKARVDGVLRAHPAVPLSYSAELTHDRLQSGQRNVDASGRVSTFIRGTSITKHFRWQSRPDSESSEGALHVSSRYGQLGVRGQINYTLSPAKEVSAVALAANRTFARQYVVNANVLRAFPTAETRYGLSVTKTIGSYGYGIGATYSSLGEIIISGQLFIALARDPRRGDWIFDALPSAETGAVSARVFVDKNLNGAMDAGEEPVQGAAFMVNRGRHPARTDADGIAYIRRLPVKEASDIAVDPSTLEDPQWAAVPAGVRLVPRAGKAVPLDFPVILTGEIDGTVYLQDKARRRELGNVTIELVNDRGQVVGRTQSAPDGFYVLSAVKPGQYQVRVAPTELAERQLRESPSRSVVVNADGSFVSGVDFVLHASATEIPAGEQKSQNSSVRAPRQESAIKKEQ